MSTTTLSANTIETIQYVAYFCMGFALTAAIYAVLNLIIWSWLAAVLAFLAAVALEYTGRLDRPMSMLAGQAVRGCSWLVNKAALRAA